MTQIIVTGDSHLGPLRRGLDLTASEHRNRFTFWPLGKGAAVRRECHRFDTATETLTTISRSWRNRVFSRETIASEGLDATVVISLPLNTSRILRDYPWDTHAPWCISSNEIALSDAMVDEIIVGDAIHALNMVYDLVKIWPQTAVLEAPRFFSNASYLNGNRIDVFTYVDTIYRNKVRNLLSESGIDVISQPDITITSEGTTALAFDHPDPLDDHHANESYGKLALEEILAYVDNRKQSSPYAVR